MPQKWDLIIQPDTGKQTRGFFEDRKNLNLKLQMTHVGDRKSRGDVVKAAFLFLRKKKLDMGCRTI